MTSSHSHDYHPPSKADGEIRARQERSLRYWKTLDILLSPAPSGDEAVHPEFIEVSDLVDGQGVASLLRQSNEDDEREVFVGVLSRQCLYDRLFCSSIQEEADEPGRSSMTLGSMRVRAGRYLKGTFVISPDMWVMSRIRTGDSLSEGYELALESVCAEVDEFFVSAEVASVTISAVCDLVAAKLGLSDIYTECHLQHRVSKCACNDSSNNEQPALNGFSQCDFDGLLERLKAGRLPPALNAYLRGAPAHRTDLGAERGQPETAAMMMPNLATWASWPAADELSASEHLVSNTLRKQLVPDGGLQAVRVPHGSSGHRIARDLVLEALTHRAAGLAAFPRTGLILSGSPNGTTAIFHPTLRYGGVAVVQPGTAGSVELCRQLSIGLSIQAESDPLVAALVRKGVIALDASTREARSSFVTAQLVGDGGIYELLQAAVHNKLPREREFEQWQEACRRYADAENHVEALTAAGVAVPELIRRVGDLRHSMQTLRCRLERHKGERQKRIETTLAELDNELQFVEVELLDPSPGLATLPRSIFRTLVACLGGSGSRAAHHDDPAVSEAEGRLNVLSEQFQCDLSDLSETDRQLSSCKQELWDAESELRASIEQLRVVALDLQLTSLGRWLSTARAADPAAEFEVPWYVTGLAEARERLFYESIRINAVFMRQQAKRLLKNLQQAEGLLVGAPTERLTANESASIWSTLHLVAPAAVFDNASAGTLFRTVKDEGFRWVVQMSAGQIRPSQMLSAVMRGRNVVVLGERYDFLNAPEVPEKLRRHVAIGTGLDCAVAATSISALHHAEAASRWKGLHLRSLECSAEPMMSIIRSSGYGETLVPRRITAGVEALDSGWIDIRGTSKNTWVPNEGRALLKILDSLWCQGVAHEQIAIVSHSSRVRTEVQKLIPSSSGFHVLAPHELSGRAYQFVIMILGACTSSWLSARSKNPAAIAIPAGAARRGLYVIGNRSSWLSIGVLKKADVILPHVELEALVERGQKVHLRNGHAVRRAM